MKPGGMSSRRSRIHSSLHLPIFLPYVPGVMSRMRCFLNKEVSS